MRYGINKETFAKLKKSIARSGLATGLIDQRLTVLKCDEEAIVVTYRKHTLCPTAERPYFTQATMQ
jgi:hypothetical protein